MTAWQELAARLESDEAESSSNGGPPADPWESAPAPAKVARKFAQDVLHRDVPPERIGLLTNVMHWGTGTGWGVVYGLLPGRARRGPLLQGALFGTLVWASSYAQLVPMGIYELPWKYPPGVLGLDLSYHLVYGVGTGVGHRAIAGSSA